MQNHKKSRKQTFTTLRCVNLKFFSKNKQCKMVLLFVAPMCQISAFVATFFFSSLFFRKPFFFSKKPPPSKATPAPPSGTSTAPPVTGSPSNAGLKSSLEDSTVNPGLNKRKSVSMEGRRFSVSDILFGGASAEGLDFLQQFFLIISHVVCCYFRQRRCSYGVGVCPQKFSWAMARAGRRQVARVYAICGKHLLLCGGCEWK
jgi:hypothetical protein